MITGHEILAFVPLSLLAVFYLISDMLTFNRLQLRENGCPIFTRPQLVSMLALYPVWIFLTWIGNMSTERGDIGVMLAMVVATTIVGRLTTIFVFNDAFELTRQQWASLGMRLVINGLWKWNNYLIFGPDSIATATSEGGERLTNATLAIVEIKT